MYTGPLQGMTRLGLIFAHGNSVGAAFALSELGIGVNLGLVVWFALIAVATMALGYAAESTLYFAKEEASHTHAFDEWASPFPSGQSASWGAVGGKLLHKVEVLEPVALGSLLALNPPGRRPGTRRPGRAGEAVADGGPAAFGRPAVRLVERRAGAGAGGAGGLVAFSVAALFLYYPAPGEAFTEIVRVRAEAETAVLTGNRDEAIRQIERWDLLTRKVQVGVFLRTATMDAAAGRATEDLRERLEELRDALLADDLAGAKKLLPPVEAAYRKCRDHYQPGRTPMTPVGVRAAQRDD